MLCQSGVPMNLKKMIYCFLIWSFVLINPCFADQNIIPFASEQVNETGHITIILFLLAFTVSIIIAWLGNRNCKKSHYHPLIVCAWVMIWIICMLFILFLDHILSL